MEPDRSAKRSLRWLLLLPALTVALFVALAAVSFLEIRWRPSPPRRGLSPQEISAETLARYREESQALGELRKRSREELTVEHLLSLFAPPENEEGARAMRSPLRGSRSSVSRCISTSPCGRSPTP